MQPDRTYRGEKHTPDIQPTTHAATMANEETIVNEASPLLRPQGPYTIETFPPLSSPTQSQSQSSSPSSNVYLANESPPKETKSSLYLFLLTLSLIGLQTVWSVELSNGTPYLLSLGITKSHLALIWIAGPLSGTLVQPYVGLKSDRCRSGFGKRRPFMVGGVVATVLSLLVLAWVREIVGVFEAVGVGARGSNGIRDDDQTVRKASLILAVVMIYILDFSINVIQAATRAFIVDSAPTHQQDSANAWASRMSGLGNIVGYLFGYVDLPRYFWFLGNTQFKVLCALASLTMIVTLAITCLCIRERDATLDGAPSVKGLKDDGVLAFSKELYLSVRKLPVQIKAICVVQFFAWIGWFPFLFYITTYIGEIYVRPIFSANPDMTEDEIDEVWQRATRRGTFGLFMFAVMTFVASVVLPWVVVKEYKQKAEDRVVKTSTLLSHTEAGGREYSTADCGKYEYRHDRFTRILTSLPKSLEIKRLTLRRAWLLSHLLFATLMLLTFVINNTTTATIVVSLVGIPWAMTNWAPFALVAAEIRKRDVLWHDVSDDPSLPQTQHGRPVSADEDLREAADQAGVVLGIHNVAIAAPQVIATLVSSAIFRALQKPRGSVGDESVAWILRFGGVAAVVAACLTRKVGENEECGVR